MSRKIILRRAQAKPFPEPMEAGAEELSHDDEVSITTQRITELKSLRNALREQLNDCVANEQLKFATEYQLRLQEALSIRIRLNRKRKNGASESNVSESEAHTTRESKRRVYSLGSNAKKTSANRQLEAVMPYLRTVNPVNNSKEPDDECQALSKENREPSRQNTRQRSKKHSCSQCGKSFYWSSQLNIHLRMHTGERPFVCTVCNAGFSAKGTLVRHQIIHTGERPFSCHICNISFNLKGGLAKHSQIHTNKLPFSCAICMASFRLKQTLARHMNTHDSGDMRRTSM